VGIGYAPCEPQAEAAKKRSKQYFRWFDEKNCALASRTAPIWLQDANSHIGFEADQSLSRSLSIGQCDPEPINFNGKMFQDVADKHYLSIINTHFPAGPTFYGNNGRTATRVDYATAPRSMHVESCNVWHHSGDRLQLVATAGRRDHRPLVTVLRASLHYTDEADEA
jgi:hypothetical protein